MVLFLLLGGGAAHAAADLQVSDYRSNPETVPNGGDMTFDIRLTNNGSDTVADGKVVIDIGAGFSVSAGGYPSYCTLTGAVGSQVLTCNLASFPSGDRTISYTAKARSVGAWPTSATISSALIADPNPANNVLSIAAPVMDGADLSVVKTDNDPDHSVPAGSVISYTLTARNDGPNATAAVKLTDNLPPASDFQFGSASGTGWSCSHSGTRVECTYSGAPVLSGNYPPVTVTGRVTRATTGTITNNAFVGLTSLLVGDPAPGNDAAKPVVTTIEPGTDLRATKAMPGTIIMGDAAVIRIGVVNDGPMAASSATVQDSIDASLTIGALPSGCSLSGRMVSCVSGALASGASKTFDIPVTGATVTSGGVPNVATVTPPNGLAEANPGNNAATVVFQVVAPSADLSVGKTKGPNPVAAGQNMTSTITVKNEGPSVLSYGPGKPLRVTDTVSADESFVSAPAPWSCAQTGNQIICDIATAGTLPVGQSISLALVTKAGAAADVDITNTACTGGSGNSLASPADGKAANDCADANVRSTTRAADLSLVKEVGLSATGPWLSSLTVPDTVNDFYLRFTARNEGGDTARNVTVTDTLPNFVNAGGFTTAVATESVSTGSVSYAAAQGRITWTMSNLASGPAQTAVVRVSRPVESGTHINKATIFSADTTESDLSNNEGQATYTINPVADVRVSDKSISPSPARVGVVAKYTIAVGNLGPNPAANVVVTDVIDPTRFELVGEPSTTKGGVTCTKNDATGTISCPMGTLNRNQNFQIFQDVRARLPFGGAMTGFPFSHQNTATITTDTLETSTANNSFTRTHDVVAPELNLSLTKQEPIGPEFDPRRFGDDLIYDVRIWNNGPSRAQNVVVTDIPEPPAGYTMVYDRFEVNKVAANGGLTLYTPPAPTCVPNGANVECRLGGAGQNHLDSGRQVIFRLYFKPNGPAPSGTLTFSNRAKVTSTEQDNTTVVQADKDLADNERSQTTTVLPSTDLEVVSKTVAGPSPASINEPVEYRIVVRNNGVSPTTQVRVTDTLPAGMTLVTTPAPAAVGAGSASVSGISCTGTSTVLCTLDGMFPANGDPVTITLKARAAHPYSGALNSNITNKASIAPGQNASGDPITKDSDPTNDEKTAVVQITGSSIAGSVYADNNGDNVIQAAERLSGVTVALTGTDTFGNTVTVPATVTDASGNYIFDRLPPGAYRLVETQPANYYDRNEVAGSAGGDVDNGVYASTAAYNTIANINLPANTAATGYVFQELAATSVEGYVYRDLNNNGVRDAGETGFAPTDFAPGQHVRLTGTDYAGNAVNLTTVVDANGRYQFTGVAPSNTDGYTVTQMLQPNGASDGLDSNGLGVVVANSGGRAAPENIVIGVVSAGQNLTERNFGELPSSTLSGVVFFDPNANATKDAGESTGIANAILRLTGTNDLGEAIDCSVTTDATGAYSFPVAGAASAQCQVLRPGTYALTETPPPGLTHTGAYIGSAGGSSGGVNTANSAAVGSGNLSVTNIVITAGTTASTYNFGENGQGLTGYVYVDRDDSGVREAGEIGIPGVTMTLSGTTASGQNVCDFIDCEAVTDAAGNFTFLNVPGADATGYTITQQAQSSAPLSAYADGKDTAGGVNGDVRGTAGNDKITGIVLQPGELGTNYAFGERAGRLAGGSYIDGNDDGIRQPDEPGIPGVTVELSGRTDDGQDICTLRASLNPALSCTVTTGPDGRYSFEDVPSGTYTLVETQPTEYADGKEGAGTPGGTVNNGSFGSTPPTNTISNIPLTPGTNGDGYDFGERAVTISGRVYKDVERDGVDAGGEPGIGGVTIKLIQNGVVIKTTTTGPDGSYSFTDLPGGSYTVEEVQPAGYGSSSPNSVNVNVTAGSAQSIDFAETVSTIGGNVFVDGSDDGVLQPGEKGIAGVTVRLTGTDDAGKPVDRSTTTDANGAFVFDDVLSGTYTITETQPDGFSDGKDSAGTTGGTVGNDVISGIVLPVGTDATGYGFGERGEGLTGTVYVDTNNNGVQDPGETPIPGVEIQLFDEQGNLVTTTVTGPDGSYRFDHLEAGSYTVVEVQPAGYGEGRENPGNRVPVEVNTGSPITPVNFGERTGSIAGGVYNDTNGNGRRDPGEPAITGVTVTLTGTDARGNAVTQTVTSGPDGSYSFTDLPGGSYTITETQPQGYDDGADTPGTAGGTPANGDQITNIVLAPATDATGYLFGERGDNAQLSGSVWFDADHDRARGPGEDGRAGWTVNLFLGDTPIASTVTGADGQYSFADVPPGTGYRLEFRNPENDAVFGGARPNENGVTAPNGVVGPNNPGGASVVGGQLTELTLEPGKNVVQQSLPLDPSGVVYDSVRRVPVAGAVVRITGPAGFDPAIHLLGGAGNAAQTTDATGAYQFLLLPGAPAGDYALAVTPPNGSYNPIQPSSIIPACVGPFAVGSTPDPMLISLSNSAPPQSAAQVCSTGSLSTAYYLGFTLTPGVSANVINNNIPIDPILEGAIEVTKTTPMVNVTRGQLVPYRITARNTLAGAITGITITDRVPAGFRYREGSATVDGVPTEPVQAGRMLNWPDQQFVAGQEKRVDLILVVGSGVGEGEHTNNAFAVNAIVDTVVSNVAEATVRIIPDPDFDCTDILGKIFDDRNANGVQDDGEPGLGGVRLASARGLLITSDAQGRYHVTCPMIPNEDRGSNFILKLDTRTLPNGYRMTTGNPETVRLTRGKFAKLNFGAAVHRVVRLDINGDAFDGEAVRADFVAKVIAMAETLAEKPSVLRIAYADKGEGARLIERRIEALKNMIKDNWKKDGDRYRLVIEDEIVAGPVAAQGGAK
ncbi:SdrD B-like domain-containing protein [Sphingomonas sp. C3-2]|uniref:SdrD B-like domain-containing protein n=1 Tax=Sphingomonas sp. C3-2 TaxID=3062169 RepID=UPI00294B4DB6|nr:SdrD B-like domain-containing protein [Sphingomonas sp. C3-2]WOK38119.1 SdrD B-like domain-containing protein [Sphingomonas sp. C3-2]